MSTTSSTNSKDALTETSSHAPTYNRRHFLHTAALTSGSLLLAACGGTSTQLQPTAKVTTVPGAQITATMQAAVGKTFFPSGDPNVPDAYTAPPPMVQSVSYVPGSGDTVNALTVSFNPPPLPLNQNKYWQALNKRLNANWQVQLPSGNEGYTEAAGHFGTVGIPSQVGSDQNRVKTLLHILDYFCAPRFSIEGDFLATGIDGWDNTKAANGVKALNATGSKEVGDLAYIENPAPIYYTPAEPSFALKLQGYAKQLQAIGITDPTAPLYSPTATKQQAQLNQVYNDRFIRFIKGTDPETSVGGFATDFLSNGGAQIAKEFQDQLQKQR